MIVENIAVKKSLAVTLSLALGLSLPAGAWAQEIGGRVLIDTNLVLPTMERATPVAPALAGLNVPAAQFVPFAARALPAPAIDAHPVLALIDHLRKAGVPLDGAGARADAAKMENAARSLPEGSSSRGRLLQLAAFIRTQHADATGAGEGARVFDGMKSASGEAPAAPETGLHALLTRVFRKAAPAPRPEDPKKFELGVEQVRYAPAAGTLPESTNAIPVQEQKVVGQDDALKAIRFALEMKPDHYNLYVAGAEGSGRAMAVRRLLGDVAPKMKTPNDLVAATNFKDKDVPVILEFAPGRAAAFQKGVQAFVEAMKAELPVALDSGEVGLRKQQIMAQLQAFEARNQQAFDAKIGSIKLARKFGVHIEAKPDEQGRVRLSLDASFNGKPMSEEEVRARVAAGDFTEAEFAQARSELQEKKGGILEDYQAMLAAVDEMIPKVSAIVQKLERDAAVGLIQERASRLAEIAVSGPGAESSKAMAYVRELADFAAANYQIFMGIQEGAEGAKPAPGSRPIDPEDFFRVSVLTDNAAAKGAPVVWEENPTYERLFGEADGNMRSVVIPGVGLVKTEGPGGPSFRAGSYLKANGGFLVLRALDAVKNPGVWPALMSAVRTGEAEIADGGFAGASMKGDLYHLPAKVKIVLIGSPMIQMLLAEQDADFAANFQAVAQFQPTIKITEEAVGGFLNFLHHSVAASAGQILALTRGAIERVLEHAARLADSNGYFTAQFGELHGLLQEASYAAQKAGRAEVLGEDVDAALRAKSDREDVHYKRMSELYRNNIFRIDTSGSAVGQINGLAVQGAHGVQMRITFVAGPGQPGLVSVDHAAGSTGASFNKALGNEYSFLMNVFGQKKALKAQIRVSYEQSYGGIDGDSSTSTTLYGILSALSGVPIRQRFAVTGSADQFGNVQAIGGVNEKIEGFFDLCRSRGLSGDQGVIIPRTNVGDLQLSPEVSQAIKDGKFHVYAVDTVAQGMEILTGAAYSTIKEKAAARLDEIAKAK